MRAVEGGLPNSGFALSTSPKRSKRAKIPVPLGMRSNVAIPVVDNLSTTGIDCKRRKSI